MGLPFLKQSFSHTTDHCHGIRLAKSLTLSALEFLFRARIVFLCFRTVLDLKGQERKIELIVQVLVNLQALQLIRSISN